MLAPCLLTFLPSNNNLNMPVLAMLADFVCSLSSCWASCCEISQNIEAHTRSAEQQSPKYNCEHVQDLLKFRHGVRCLRRDASGQTLAGRFSSHTLKDAGSSLSALERCNLFWAKVDYKKSNLIHRSLILQL